MNEGQPLDASAQAGRTWANPDIGRYEGYRATIEPAYSLSLGTILNTFPPRGKVLELGAGGGALKSRFPHEFDTTTHIDISRSALQNLKTAFPDARVVEGDCYRLPIRSNTMNNVYALNTFDVLDDMDNATKQVKRVLKRQGRFTHMLDLQPHPESLILNAKARGVLLLPAPKFKTRNGIEQNAFRYTHAGDLLEWFEGSGKNVLNEAQKRQLRLLITDTDFFVDSLAHNPHLMDEFGILLETIHAPGQMTVYSDIFSHLLADTLLTNGFTKVQIGRAPASAIVSREELLDRSTNENPQANVILHVPGHANWGIDSTLPPEHGKIISQVAFVTAVKR